MREEFCQGREMVTGGHAVRHTFPTGSVELYRGRVVSADINLGASQRVWICGEMLQITEILMKGVRQLAVGCPPLPTSSIFSFLVEELEPDRAARIAAKMPEHPECCRMAKARAVELMREIQG